MEMDYSLLRPFDLELAKAGASICFKHDRQVATFVGESSQAGKDICVRWEETRDSVKKGTCAMLSRLYVCMTPLCWVEGKPVYKGDVLWRNLGILGPERVTVDRVTIDSDGDVFLHYSNGGNSWVDGPDHMTTDVSWTYPKLKYEGWINVYRHNQNVVGDIIWDSKRNADLNKCDNRVDCVRIEWEESAK